MTLNTNDIAFTEATEFAIMAHGTQMYGPHPYKYHLDAVDDILVHYGFTGVARVIGRLHDVAEDTSYTIEDIRKKFGNFIANCCAVLTDEPGANRKERKFKTNFKMSLIKDPDPRMLALVIKAADRLANVRGGIKNEMYKAEHAAFKVAAFHPGLCDGIWNEIDTILGFK